MGKMRDLVLESGTWGFTVGKQHVKLRAPDGKSWVVGCGVLLGVTDWDEGGYAIGPGDVRHYIEHELLGIPRPPLTPAPTRDEVIFEKLQVFVRYAELLRRAWLNPSHEPWQHDLRDFECKHEAELEQHWRAWQMGEAK